jgi:hypothetical protein
MGRNNVRSGHDLLLRAGNGTEILSVVPEFNNLPMVIIGYDFLQDDLDQYINVIRFGHNDTWAQFLSSTPKSLREPLEQPKFTDGPTDQRLTVPKIHVSQGLRDFRHLGDYLPGGQRRENHEQPDLVYILVVQGCSGAFRSKLVLRTNLQTAGAEMFYEAVNGFSVVFTGAMLKKNLERRADQKYCFKKADTLDELQAMDADESQKIIGVMC